MTSRDAVLAALSLGLADEFPAAEVPAMWEELSGKLDAELEPFALEDLQEDLERVVLSHFEREQGVRLLKATFARLVTLSGSDDETKVGLMPPIEKSASDDISEQESEEGEVAPPERLSERISLRPHASGYVHHSEGAVIVDLRHFLSREIDELTDNRHVLMLLTGPNVGKSFCVTGPETIIGRSRSSEVWLRDEGISRSHAKLFVGENDFLSLIDLGSKNGSFRNGERVSRPVSIKDGDLLRFANTILRYIAGPRVDSDREKA